MIDCGAHHRTVLLPQDSDIAGTVYFDAQRLWSFSALTRTLMHTEQDETKVTPGTEFVVEYGLGKEIPISDKFSIRPGLAGCAYWQIEDDSDDGPNTVADERKKAYALGAEINRCGSYLSHRSYHSKNQQVFPTCHFL